MLAHQLWAYIGWVLFTIFACSILFLSYALYRDYTLTKNKKTSLPSLEVIEADKKMFFENDSTTSNDLAENATKIPSRRSLRGAKAGNPSSPAVEVAPSAFFDDDEEFTLLPGQD